MIQLFTNKLKMVANLFLLVFFITAIAAIVMPKNVLASTYGEGTYGDCPYGQNGCNEDGSPVVPSSETNSNSSSSDSNDLSDKVAITNPTILAPTFSISDPTSNTNTSMLIDSTPTFTTQYPTLSGHTDPYATVIIEIDGVPVEVIADANGDWQYKVTDPLSFGEHTIKITIKEKDTDKLISEGTYKINIAKKAEAKDNDTASPKNHRTLTIIGIIVLSLIAIIILFFLIARSRRKKHHNY